METKLMFPTVIFHRTESEAKLLAIFLAELSRQGCAYSVDSDQICFQVTITGF